MLDLEKGVNTVESIYKYVNEIIDEDIIKRVLATCDRKFIEEIKNIENTEKVLSEKALEILKCNF